MPDAPAVDSLESKLRRRRRIRITIITAITALLSLSLLDNFGALRHAHFLRAIGIHNYPGDDVARFSQRSFVVDQIIDGMTLRVSTDHGPQRVRLIGLTTPAPSAKPFLVEQVLGKSVTLLFESTDTRDSEGHLLAYVFLDASKQLTTLLLREGHARLDPKTPILFFGEFQTAEAIARKREAKAKKETQSDSPE